MVVSTDEQMVTFAFRWMPFGGSADDEIFTLFGVTPVQFYLRVIELANRHGMTVDGRPVCNSFVAYCNHRVREHMAIGRRGGVSRGRRRQY